MKEDIDTFTCLEESLGKGKMDEKRGEKEKEKKEETTFLGLFLLYGHLLCIATRQSLMLQHKL